jgi:hypothetical protein
MVYSLEVHVCTFSAGNTTISRHSSRRSLSLSLCKMILFLRSINTSPCSSKASKWFDERVARHVTGRVSGRVVSILSHPVTKSWVSHCWGSHCWDSNSSSDKALGERVTAGIITRQAGCLVSYSTTSKLLGERVARQVTRLVEGRVF